MISGRYTGLLLTVATVAAVPEPSHAQRAGDGFLFRTPSASIGLYGGFDRAMAGGDVFGFVTDQLTLSRGDFSSATIGGNFAVRVSPTTDIVFDLSYASVARFSEFRDWVDQNDLPIVQTTSLRRVPVTVSFKRYLASRGRSIGRFAWIPAARAIYVGAGAGVMHYRFHQVGDFVDFQTLNVFHDEFESSAWTPVLQGFAGVEIGLGQHFVLTGEGRCRWAKGPMGRDYIGFDRIDLSGLSVTAGLSVRL